MLLMLERLLTVTLADGPNFMLGKASKVSMDDRRPKTLSIDLGSEFVRCT